MSMTTLVRRTVGRAPQYARQLMTITSFAVLAGTSACSDDGGPSAGIAGTYYLTSVGGNPLPYSIRTDLGGGSYSERSWAAGQIQLKSDGTYTVQTRGSSSTYGSSGTYRVQGSTIEFTDLIGDDYYTGVLRDRNASIVLGEGQPDAEEYRR